MGWPPSPPKHEEVELSCETCLKSVWSVQADVYAGEDGYEVDLADEADGICPLCGSDDSSLV